MAVTRWLIDKSALVHLPTHPDRETWRIRIERGLVRVSTVTRLEVGFSARSGSDHVHTANTPPMSLLVPEYLTPAIENRAVEVQALLATRGYHRAPSIPDLLIAATAELTGFVVLAHNKDFALIAQITGQHIASLNIAESGMGAS